MSDSDSTQPETGLRAETRSPAPRKGRRATRTTTRILEAGRQVFRERGYAGTSVDAIAEAAGIARASVYTYFRSKRDILITLGVADNARMQETISAFPDTLDRAAVAGWVSSYLDLLEKDHSLYYTWTEAARTDKALRSESLSQYGRAWRTLTGRIAATTGTKDASAGESVDGLLLMATFERSVTYLQDLHAEVTREQVVDRLVDLIRGLAHTRVNGI